MTTQLPELRRHPFRVIAAVWLLLISALALLDHFVLSKLAQDIKADTRDAALAELHGKIADLQQQVNILQRQPVAISQATFTTARQVLEERLAKVEKGIGGSAGMEDITLLQNRLRTLEAQVSKVSRTLARPNPTASTPIAPEPPFSVLGIEMRGGERVLALAPLGLNSPTQTRLLRIGESQDNWQLTTLNANTAEFQVNGRLQRIVVP